MTAPLNPHRHRRINEALAENALADKLITELTAFKITNTNHALNPKHHVAHIEAVIGCAKLIQELFGEDTTDWVAELEDELPVREARPQFNPSMVHPDDPCQSKGYL